MKYKRICMVKTLAGYGGSSLYAGDENLIVVESVRSVERYRRFFYADIKGIALIRTAKNFILCMVGVGFMVLGGLGAWAARDPEVKVMGVVSGIIGLFFVLYYLMYGQSCVTSISTLAGTQKLHMVNTMRRARKLKRILLPHIEAAQNQ